MCWLRFGISIRVVDDTFITFKLSCTFCLCFSHVMTTLSCAVITAVLSSLEDGGGPWLAVTVKRRNDSGGYDVTWDDASNSELAASEVPKSQ